MTEQHEDPVIRVGELGFPWETPDPFLFCVYHADDYPEGNERLGPSASLEGRNIGYDFILRDGWRMYHGTTVPGFPAHPHRGFETVTVVRNGFVDHSDSLGGAGRYGMGDVQWLTAGKGVQHCEMFPLLNRDARNPLELFQIWLNLPASSKYVEPHFKMLWAEQIPHHTFRDSEGRETAVEVYAGSLDGRSAPAPAPDSWAADILNDVAIWYFQMSEGASWSLPPCRTGSRRTLYFFEGDEILAGNRRIGVHHLIEIHADQTVIISNGNVPARFLMLQGKPIGEPVASHGPFVMNTGQEIQQTYIDFRTTGFGGWPWPRKDQVHPGNKSRFALFPDGKEQSPEQ